MVKLMLHEEMRNSGTGRSCSSPGGTAVRAWMAFTKKVQPYSPEDRTLECSSTDYKCG